MSPRGDRISDSKRRRSRFDRETSPKRCRRDGKPGTERPPAEPEFDKSRSDLDHKHHRRFEHSSDRTKVPQCRSSYFRHDDCGIVGKNGRNISRKTVKERGWWTDPKEHQNDRATNKPALTNTHHNDEKAKDNNGYFENEPDTKPDARKRPSFREQKVATDQEKIYKATKDPVMYKYNPPQDHARRDERGQTSRRYDKPERSFAGEGEMNKSQAWGRNFASRDRFSASSRYKARQDYGSTQGRVEKWKHDLYNEANRSPTPKNEDDQISKIEELLAS